MQVNRLSHLIFPPTTPQIAGAQGDATTSDTDGAGLASGVAAGAPVAPKRAERVVPEVAATPTPGVAVDLESSKKTQAALTYGRDGVMGGKPKAAADATPAEAFVASAVNILRDFEQGKGTFPGGVAANPSAAHRQGLFGSIKQAVSRLNVQA